MHLHPVLASQAAIELQRERTDNAIAAAEVRRRLQEQPEGRTVRRMRRRRRLFGLSLGGPRYAA
jgi:hypothetical protein